VLLPCGLLLLLPFVEASKGSSVPGAASSAGSIWRVLLPRFFPLFQENRFGAGADFREGHEDRPTVDEVWEPPVLDRERGRPPTPAMLLCSDGGTAVTEIPPLPPPPPVEVPEVEVVLSYEADFAFALVSADRRFGEPF